MSESVLSGDNWPALDWEEWKETAETLHMLVQIVGKTRLALTPVQNHWWNVPLYVTARGLSTSAMPVAQDQLLDIEFDFIAHELVFRLNSAQIERIALRPCPVADFFAEYLRTLDTLGVAADIHPLPCELKEPIRFDQDVVHRVYDADAVSRFWRVLCRVDTLLKRFSTNFYGKISPVHFFWGAMDIAVTRFNGRKAPVRAGADSIQAEAYSHECISTGFWPGNGGYGQAAFYSYAAPVPESLRAAVLTSRGAFNQELGEFILNYDDVRESRDPSQEILNFFANTYDAAANAAGWDRTSLDRHDRVGAAAVNLPQADGFVSDRPAR